MLKSLSGGGPAFYQGISAVRVAPSRGGRPAAIFWKFWVEKDELYATRRMGGNEWKISVHSSGQIHMHMGPRNTQPLAPPAALGSGLWRHALEIRFLLGAGADLPPEKMVQMKKKKDKALIVPVPDGHVLCLNLLVSALAASSLALPIEFSGTPEVWRTRLRDGRSVVLLGRVMPFDAQSISALRDIRSVIQPKANYVGLPSTEGPYNEVIRTSWSQHGNVVLVIPMGAEGRRFDPEDADATSGEPLDSRAVTVECADSSADLFAPDGSIIGAIAITGVAGQVSLVKDKEVVQAIGHVALRIYPGALRWGNKFSRPRFSTECALTVGGITRESWAYVCDLSFDGSTVSVSIFQLSTSFRAGIKSNVISGVEPGEEIIVRAPVAAEKMLRLIANENQVSAGADFPCGFRLRDILSSHSDKSAVG